MLKPELEARADGFLTSIRESMPDVGPVREALTFAKLVMGHPSPPRDLAALRKSLWSLTNLDAADPVRAAELMRRAGHNILQYSHHTSTGQVLELALLAMSLRFDDTPQQRMLSVDLGLMAAGVEVIGIEDPSPAWKPDGSPTSLMSPGAIRHWIAAHVDHVCRMSLDESLKVGDRFKSWNMADLECSLLALRMNYCIFRATMSSAHRGDVELEKDFDDVGTTVWNQLQAEIVRRPLHLSSAPTLRNPAWNFKTRNAVRAVIRPGSMPSAAIAPPPSPAAVKPVSVLSRASTIARPNKWDIDDEPIDGPSLIVCRNPIVPATERTDKDEVERHKPLESPLPLAPMPSVDAIQDIHGRLMGEFPWAEDVLATIFDDLLGRAKLGVLVLAMPPTLLVGPPGSGKSRLAVRIAEELGLPRLNASLGGSADTKVLGGTSRGWGGGKPNDVATLMALRKTASAIVLLDELDKALEGYRLGSGIQAFLLGLLEPETARRHSDPFLKTECDFSAVLWIATANQLSSITAPLRSRMRILMLRQPGREHFEVIATNVLTEVSRQWGLERSVLPDIAELGLQLNELGSARQVRTATLAAVTSWAKSLKRH